MCAQLLSTKVSWLNTQINGSGCYYIIVIHVAEGSRWNLTLFPGVLLTTPSKQLRQSTASSSRAQQNEASPWQQNTKRRLPWKLFTGCRSSSPEMGNRHFTKSTEITARGRRCSRNILLYRLIMDTGVCRCWIYLRYRRVMINLSQLLRKDVLCLIKLWNLISSEMPASTSVFKGNKAGIVQFSDC